MNQEQSETKADTSSLFDDLFQRLAGEESSELEFKSAHGGLPKNIWETISAFANTKGGWIVLGAVERDRRIQLEGVKNTETQLKNFFDLMRSPQKISYPVCGVNDVSIDLLGERNVILVRVPAAPRKARPIFINQNPYSGTFLRRHEGDYRATKPEVDRMMREASDIGADTAILKRYDLEDIDRDTLARYRRRYQTQHPDWVQNTYDDLDFLKALNGYRQDRETGERGLTVAGLLMFGTAQAIREWRTRHLIDYRVASVDADADSRWNDRVEWEGNLLGAFETLSPRLVRDQPIPFVMQGETRIAEGPIHAALREALVNLLVHADYAETLVSLIQRTPEGYAFRNPGSSRVPEGDLFTGNRSDPRNPELVRMFRLIGLAEEAGTGIPNILKTWRNLGFQMPRIDVGTERYEFNLELRHAHLLSDADRIWLNALGTNWSEAEQLALVCARHEDSIDNLRLRQLTGLHPADATKVLSNLRNRQLLTMVRSGRGAYYHLGSLTRDESAYAHQRGALNDVGQHEISRAHNIHEKEPLRSLTSTGDNAPSTGDNAPSTGDNAPSTGDNAPHMPDYEPELLSISLAAHHRQRLTPEELDSLLVRMCVIRPLSIQELSTLLGRTVGHVRKTLSQLIAEGKLIYLYPNQPQHPQQRYLARTQPLHHSE